MGIKFEAGSGSVLLYARRLYLVVTCCFGQFNFLVIISCAFSHKVNESLHVLILLKLSYLTSLRTKSFTKKLDDTRDEKEDKQRWKEWNSNPPFLPSGGYWLTRI